MKVIGLTGGSGAGKGYVCALFALYGIPSLDTDRVSRQVTEPGQPCLNELTEAFGNGILRRDGSLDRQGLGKIVFADSEKLATLNAITHRYILAECRRWLEERREEGCFAAIIDAPVLYESGFDEECDLVIAVLAPAEVRISRIVARDGITEGQAKTRIEAQKDDAFFYTYADHIIINDGERDTAEQVRAVAEQF